MEDFFDQENTEAFVYLMSEGDDKNKAMISSEKLMVVIKKKRKTLNLNDILSLKTETKKLLFPLILGGIITPFAFLSYFVNPFLPWIHLSSVMLGLLLFYVGWTGKYSFTVILKNNDELNFYLPSISHNLLAFIEYVNFRIKNPGFSENRNLLFFIIDKRDFQTLTDINKSQNQSLFPIKGYTFNQLEMEKKNINYYDIIAVDPNKAGREIKFSYDLDSKQMRPYIDGPILPESIQ